MQEWNTLKFVAGDRNVATVAMNRPERRNAISTEMARELEACFAGLKASADVRAVILTGEGTAFCAGADLKERAGMTPDATRRQRETALRIVELIETLPMPVIGMVNGPAVAGGLELALACDIRIASDRATFALTEVRNMGSFPGSGGPVRLPKLIGRGRASYLVLTGRSISARDAYEFGLVEAVVPHDDLAKQTLAIASEIAGNSPTGVAAAKRLIRQSNDLDVNSATELSRALRDPLDGSRDYAEGLKSWLAGSAPDFKSR
jgi:enoyl-CoA hydratase